MRIMSKVYHERATRATAEGYTQHPCGTILVSNVSVVSVLKKST